MRTRVLAAAVSLALLTFGTSAMADERLARFEGGIGVVPVRVTGGVAAQNIVRGTNPGGAPWVISRLSADVNDEGRISVSGRGLLLGGSDAIGTPGVPPQSVRAKLFCNGTAPTFADATVHQNPNLVTLEADGDFRIEDVLAPSVPSQCANPVLLIVSAGGSWFAAGIPKQ
jgi:hypothetical protein